MLLREKLNYLSLENKIRTLSDKELFITIFFGRYLTQVNKINLTSDEITSYFYYNQREVNFLDKWIQIIEPNLKLITYSDFYSSHAIMFKEYFNMLLESNNSGLIFNIEDDLLFLHLENRYISKTMGRFYTPHKLITSTFGKIKEFSEFRGLSSIFDPTMGSGRFFAAFLDLWLSRKVIPASFIMLKKFLPPL